MEQFRRRQTQTNLPADDTPAAPAGENLLEQARAYANVARMAGDNCQQGREAEQDLHNRRNRSGE